VQGNKKSKEKGQKMGTATSGGSNVTSTRKGEKDTTLVIKKTVRTSFLQKGEDRGRKKGKNDRYFGTATRTTINTMDTKIENYLRKTKKKKKKKNVGVRERCGLSQPEVLHRRKRGGGNVGGSKGESVPGDG